MNNEHQQNKNLIRAYHICSTLMVLICVLGASAFFTKEFVEKEAQRASIFRTHLLSFFDYQYQRISEESWTKSYDSIGLRIEQIAKQIGSEKFDVEIYDKEGHCVFATGPLNIGNGCNSIKDISINWKQTFIEPLLDFDTETRLHVYQLRLEIGEVKLGWLRARFSDPYQFLLGHESIEFAVNAFLPVAFITVLVWLLWLFVSRFFLIEPYLKSYASLKKRESLAKLATQVAHDIRSPIESLDVLLRNLQLPDDRRHVLGLTITRIKDIANDLLRMNSEQTTLIQKEKAAAPFLISSVIEQVISEKRSRFREKNINYTSNVSSYLGFSKVDKTDFARVLSNLLDNASEAINENGIVEVNVRTVANSSCIEIKDNGYGIPKSILDVLGRERIISGKKNGTGIGFLNAAECVRSWNGQISISSDVGIGTKIELTLPAAPTPDWFCSHLSIPPNGCVVIVDDEPSIYEMWKERFASLQGFDMQRLLFYKSPDYLSNALKANEIEAPALFLIDYEFKTSSENGIQLISRAGIQRHSILVTSRNDENEIIGACAEMGLLILPKAIAPHIKIEIQDRINEVDAILIDDEIWVRDAWELEASKFGKKIRGFKSYAAASIFLNAVGKDILCFVDQKLQGDEDGKIVTQKLVKQGFKQVYLATGFPKDRFADWDWVKGVVGKEPPAWFLHS